MTNLDIIKIAVTKTWSLEITISTLLLLIFAALIIFWVIKIYYGLQFSEAEIGFGANKAKYKVNYTDKQIAYKIWVELETRKIGLMIDKDHDVITQIYDSWYKFFSVARDLIKDIPVEKSSQKSTKKIIDTSIEVLNIGLRPHLTQWQARFRKWNDSEIEKEDCKEMCFQDIQQRYPLYNDLYIDMEKVNLQLIDYKNQLQKIVWG